MDEAGGRHPLVIAVVKADEVEPIMGQPGNSACEDWDFVDIEIGPEDAVAKAMPKAPCDVPPQALRRDNSKLIVTMVIV